VEERNFRGVTAIAACFFLCAALAAGLHAAPVTYYDSSGTAVDNTSNLSVNINTTGPDGMLIVSLYMIPLSSTPTVSAISYDNIPMQFVTSETDSLNIMHIDIYKLANPPTGDFPVSVTMSTVDDAIMTAISYYDVCSIGAMAMGVETVPDSSGGTAYFSVTVATTTANSVVTGIAFVRSEYDTTAIDPAWNIRLSETCTVGDRDTYNADEAAPVPGNYVLDFSDVLYAPSNGLAAVAMELINDDSCTSPTPTCICSPSITLTATYTPSQTATPTLTNTVTLTVTLTPFGTETVTATVTPTFTLTVSPTAIVPFCLTLYKNSPNPFSQGTNLIFYLCRQADVNVKIYTISGEVVRELSQQGGPGMNSIYWDAKNGAGRPVASGVFIYSIEAAGQKSWGKMAVVK
jgi:hypothetical protein